MALPHSDGPRDASNPHPAKRRLTSRAALLGTAAALALGGAFYGNVQLPNTTFTAPAHADTTAPAQGPTGFASIVNKVKGAVVSIKVKVNETADANDTGDQNDTPPQLKPGSPLYRFFKRFGGEMPFEFRDAHPHVTQAQGSGFFISADGYIVTNDHVVDHATDVQIVMDNGKILPAKVVGTDKKTDLALLKVSTGSNYPS
jgi:serine protease Do